MDMSESLNQPNVRPQGIHIMAKPNGPLCNLCCKYCFYTEKEALFPKGENYRMSDEILNAYIRNNLALNSTAPEIPFVWQGGEPTLSGIDFFRKVVRVQKACAGHQQIKNSLQTNGTMLTDEWCAFLKEHNFMVGISLDGPENIHDRYRVDRGDGPTFHKVMRGLKLLQKHGVEYNVMACVAKETAHNPLDVYHFFKSEGVKFMQFFPIVERHADSHAQQCGFRLAGPSSLDKKEENVHVTDWTVEPEKYGDFLVAVFDDWVRNDVGNVFVMNFEWALNAWIGNASPVCLFAKQCGNSIVMEHNGDIYACDHSVYPQHKLGNILTDDPLEAVGKLRQSGFGVIKETALPRWCLECDVLAACHGGCPKHRFASTCYDEPGLQYLCPGYKKFFLYIRKYLKIMTQLLENGLPVSYVMKAVKGPLVIRSKQCAKK
jgi:uncharacterized protein